MERRPVSAQLVKDALSQVGPDVKEDLNNSQYNGVYLFFSFDLVNSTIFKTTKEWQQVFKRFYELIETLLQNKYGEEIKLWKYIGDEVLLYLKVTEFDQIYKCAPIVSKVIKDVIQQLYKDYPYAKQIIFIKSTIWLADVIYQQPNEPNKNETTAKNIVFFVGNNPEWLDGSQVDFLGPDIDLGFRLSKFAQKSKVLISADLAYILNRKKGEIESFEREDRVVIDDSYKIVSYETLKGIWNNRRYPIIWFGDSWSKDDYDYDEHIESLLVRNVIEEKHQDINKIGKIIADLNKTKDLENIIEKISKVKKVNKKIGVKYKVPRERLAEIHCAAVCLDNKNRVFIAKRSESKKRLAGLWEFGCGQLTMNQSVKTCLELNYKNDFNADLGFLEEPLPVKTYNIRITSEKRVVPGILFVAEILNQEDELSYNKEIHSEIKWIEKDKIYELREDECVPGFHDTVEKAFKIYDLYKNK
ncbi:hypothetical protein [Bacillus subtilis]|uniref:hypothetical protein n=1 Tax=Bacillus subtilis TaxID=1423 RepID=UPI001BCDB018|nr:hypothetical protein [Bacillus subtilis]MED4559636.1 hypothetical protein [Bacillus subtilis]